MKLTAILLFTACLQVSANTYSQTITLRVENAPLDKVVKEIEKQSKFNFFYKEGLFQNANPVTLSVSKSTLQQTLDALFNGQPFEYKIVQNTVFVKGKELIKGEQKEVSSRNLIDIKGRVVNEKGEPVAGVTIRVKGTSKSTITDANGEFLISMVDNNAVLIFTHVAMETFNVNVSGRQDLLISLKTKVSALGELTVTVNTGYEKLPKERSAGSFTYLAKEQLDQRIAPDIISKLEGISNGLVFQKDPSTGSNVLKVRGESTIFANGNPLIVLDNFPYDGNINNINPNDVENITILKDAAAASIWGVQAGNGVIVITTRKGKLNQPINVEANANYSVAQKPDLYYSHQINPSDYVDLETFLFSKNYYSSALSNINKTAVSPVVEILNNRKLGLISFSDSAIQLATLRDQDWRNDYKKYIYDRALNKQYQINISGGAQKLSYYFSTGFDDNRSHIVGNADRRVTITNQTLFTPFENFELTAGVVLTESSSQNRGINSIQNIYPYTRLVDENGVQLAVPQHRARFEDTITNRNFLDWKYYPLKERDNSENELKNHDTRLYAGVKYIIIKGLSLEGKYQYERSISEGSNLATAQSYQVRNLMNTFGILDPNKNYIGSNFPNGGLYDVLNSNLIGNYGRTSLNFNRNFNGHTIAFILGFEAREVKTESWSNRYYGFNKDNGTFTNPNLFALYPQYPSNIDGALGTYSDTYVSTINRFRSYFGNSSYTYKNRYTVSLSGRLDGSNYFGVRTNQKNVPLWSSGIKWDISKEKFYKVSQVPLLSFRVTYGYNGNMAQNIAAITTFKYANTTDPLTGLKYAGLNNIPNPDLRWEKIGQLNLGLDFSLIHNRIYGSVEYFSKKGVDLIGDSPIDPTTGVSLLRGNFSALKSRGVDVQITSKILETTLKWTSSVIFNYSAEKVTRYDAIIPVNQFLTSYFKLPIPGKPLYSIYSFNWAGLDPTTGDPRIYLGDTVAKYTSYKASLLKQSDLVYSGRFNPPIAGSFYNTIGYKGLVLGFNITYKFNYYFRRSSINYASLISNMTQWQTPGAVDYASRWQKPGDEAITNVPSFVYPNPVSTNRDDLYSQSNILIEKGDHIRLQFINLGYSFNKHLTENLPIKTIQLNFYVNNVGILWRANKENIDPDYPYLSFPPSRTYSIGLKAGF